MKFKEGSIVYFVENGIRVKEARVVSAGGLYTIAFQGNSSDTAVIRLRENRLYPAKEEAEKHVLYRPKEKTTTESKKPLRPVALH